MQGYKSVCKSLIALSHLKWENIGHVATWAVKEQYNQEWNALFLPMRFAQRLAGGSASLGISHGNMATAIFFFFNGGWVSLSFLLPLSFHIFFFSYLFYFLSQIIVLPIPAWKIIQYNVFHIFSVRVQVWQHFWFFPKGPLSLWTFKKVNLQGQ